jgi:hypothetical protein
LPNESISSSDETTSAKIASVSNGESKSAISGAISLKNLEQDTKVIKVRTTTDAGECKMFKIGERKAPGLLSIASVFRILIGLNVDPYTDTDPDPAF